jgi:hypothetical protein
MLKILTLTLTVILTLVIEVSTASAQPKDSPPISPLVIRMPIYDKWSLTIVSNGKQTTSLVVYEWSGFLNTTRGTIAIEDCDKVAGAIKAAADAVQSGKPIGVEQFGNVSIGIGSNPEGHKSVMIRGGERALLFTSPIEQYLPPEEAKKFALSLHAVPGAHVRLMSSIDFKAIWKTK